MSDILKQVESWMFSADPTVRDRRVFIQLSEDGSVQARFEVWTKLHGIWSRVRTRSAVATSVEEALETGLAKIIEIEALADEFGRVKGDL